ncbi:MAG: polyprenyl synthetase family protein [Myxococcota bacterium]
MSSRLAAAKARIDQALEQFLRTASAAARARSPDLGPLIDASEALTRRGGKRLRALLVVAGHDTVAAAPTPGLLEVAIAFELLQTYLLIQDDWMDEDLVRRGGPSVHALLRQTHAPEHRADAAAILASDLAFGQALSALVSAPLPLDRRTPVLEAFTRMHEEVVLGQYLDVVQSRDVETVHLYKTAGYTVIWPLIVGARAAGAGPEIERALSAFGTPLGLAFQLKDDLLGTFGASEKTGKSAGGDLAEGKETALIAAARKRGADLTPLFAVFGKRDAEAAELALARAVLERSGAKADVESELARLRSQAETALEGAAFRPEAKAMLSEILQAIVERDA